MNDDDVKRLLEIRIRRISAYDIEKHASELEAVLEGQRSARDASETELKRARKRGAALQHQLRVVQGQLGQDKPQGPPPWWRRFSP